jgi:hypothetical protein
LQVNQQNVLEFWHQNQVNFPFLYCIASMLLSATSVPSERLFSDAGNNLYDKRNGMTAECFQMLMFLYENLEFLNYYKKINVLVNHQIFNIILIFTNFALLFVLNIF